MKFFSTSALEFTQALEEFIQRQCLDSESGYVFFGSKPLAFGGASKYHAHLIDSSCHELDIKLRLGIKDWQKCSILSESDHFLLKIREDKDSYEVVSLNKKRILEVVQENLPLFQYVFGAKANPENIFSLLANGKDRFLPSILHNNAIAGILLGFGTTNSILGSRFETLLSSLKSTPNIPYASVNPINRQEAWDYLTLVMLYENNFADVSTNGKKPLMGMSSIKEELATIENLEIQEPSFLWKHSPKLIFMSYKNDPKNDELLATYEQEQLNLIHRLDSKDFVDQVLSKIGVYCVNKDVFKKALPPAPSDLANALLQDLESRKYSSFKGAKEGLEDALSDKPNRYNEINYALCDRYYELWTINEIKAVETPNSIQMRALKKGFGERLDNTFSKGTFNYSIELANDANHFPIKSEREAALDLNLLFPGFAKGVQGMQVGEIREIEVPPQEAYGLFTDFKKWQALSLKVELLAIDKESPTLKAQELPLAPGRALFLSSDEQKEFEELKNTLSYFAAKRFYTFHKDSSKEGLQELIEALKQAYTSSDRTYNLQALDCAALKVYQDRDLAEKAKAENLFSTLDIKNSLVPNRLYLEYSAKGTLPVKTATLNFKDLEGNLLSQMQIDAQTELSCLSEGLRIGLKDLKAGDKGKLYIHPDLCSKALFRNPNAGKALIVEFSAEG